MGHGLHYTEVLPEELRVKFTRKSYPISKSRAKKAELVNMARENLPDGFKPVVEMSEPDLNDIKNITELITDMHINKFRENRANMLLASLRCGMSVKKACQLAGITVETYRSWYERGQRGEEPYSQFYTTLESIQLEMETWCLQSIRDAADRQRCEITKTTVEKPNGDVQTTEVVKPAHADWRAAAWLLEHIDPEVYGKNQEQQQNVTNNNTQIVVQLPSNGRNFEGNPALEVAPKRGRGRPRKM